MLLASACNKEEKNQIDGIEYVRAHKDPAVWITISEVFILNMQLSNMPPTIILRV